VSRLATIRRLYFYLIALVSLIVALVGLDGLLRHLSDAWLGAEYLGELFDEVYARQSIARNAGALLVAVPIFLLHWGYMGRRQGEPEERGAVLRKFFLYSASAVTVVYSVVNTVQLMGSLARLAFGEPLESNRLWPSEWLHLLLMTLVTVTLQRYLHGVLLGDGDYGRERGFAGSWRRLYQAAAGLLGLGLLLQGGFDILAALWRLVSDWFVAGLLVTGSDWWRYQLSDGIALALTGAVVTRINWRRWRRTATESPIEATSALRRFYLYAAVVVSALAALLPVTSLLREVLLILFDSSYSTWGELANRLVESLPYLPFGLLAWVWYRRILSEEAERFGESSEGATVRRLYYYAVAATGLALLWFGAVSLLQALLDWLLVTTPEAGRIWSEPLANGLSLLAVGAPLWSLHWRTIQRIARQPDADGMRERASLPRRVYLYGVALIGALLILFYLASVVYRVLLLLLGDPEAGLFSASTVGDLARSLIAATLWGVHLLAIRGDTGLGTDVPEAPKTSEEQRAALQARITQLEQELSEARAALTGLETPP
jgi:hypothetical protein